MKRYSLCYMLFTLVIVVLMGSCIKNDIPYPHIEAQIISIEADGLVSPPDINNMNRTVYMQLDDTVDLTHVAITDVTITEGAVSRPDIVGVHNLSRPQEFVLSIYQDYVWTIEAVQDIARNFTVEGQVGGAVIDVENKTARVVVSEDVSLDNVVITQLVLGSKAITEYTPPIDSLSDFSDGYLTVTVSYHSVQEEWTLYVEHAQHNIELTQVDAWSRVAWLYGSGLEDKNNRFEIREKSAGEWTAVPEEYMIKQGREFVARVVHLTPNTTYAVRAVAGDEMSDDIVFTTEEELVLPNASFDDWWLDGRVWSPWLEDGLAWWDTGNRGASLLGESNTVPTDDAVEGMAALLQTRFVGVLGIGKLAAGNIFAGSFGSIQGLNGVIYLGRTFNLRPTRLRGYYKFSTGIIDYTDNLHKELLGKPDTMTIYVALGDWSEPVEIRTDPGNRKLFDVNDAHIIAYQSIEQSGSIDEYIPFTLELEYRSTSRKPTYLIITATSSKLGDFFTGSTGSVLYLDELSLEWDYW